MYNSFYPFWKHSQSIPLIDKYNENLLLVFYHYENLYWFFPLKILFQFSNIYCCIQGLCKNLFNSIADFDPNFINFFSILLSFIKKDIYLVPSKSLLYALTFGSIIRKGTFCSESSLFSTKYLKFFLSKETLVDTTILPMFTSCIKMWLLCWWNLYFSTLSSLYMVIRFLISFYFYNALTSFVKVAFYSKFTAPLLLMLLIIQW